MSHKNRKLRLCSLAIWACLLTQPLCAASYFDMVQLPILSGAERHSMMYSFVDRNLPPIELPSNLADWQARRQELRAQILATVGLPQLDRRSAVKWLSNGFIVRDRYTIEKIIYESYPGMWVSALVYTPKGLQVPAPAMVSVPGHVYCEGKANEGAQARNVNLVLRGLIVISYDYIDTFERNTGMNPCALMPYGGGNDHGLTGFSFTGPETPTGLEILDAVRAIDYLYTRKDVDRTRIGFTGESGGGNTTYWISALDDRIHLSVPVCAVTSFDYWIRNDRDWDWHQRPFGIRRVADIWTLLALAAPHPLLVIQSLRGTDSDEAPVEEAETAVRLARKIYDLYGKGGEIQFWESNTSHGYQLDKRQRMYAWVEKHFLGGDANWSREKPFLFEPQTDLVCGLPPGNQTLQSIYQEWIRRPTPYPAVPQTREALSEVQESLRNRLVKLLGLPTQFHQGAVTVVSATSRTDVLIKRLVIDTQPGIRLPAVAFEPRVQKARATVIFPHISQEFTSAIPEMISRGLRVLLVDLRGIGEIDSGGRRTDNWAWFMGRSWPSLWVEDLNGVIGALSAEYHGSPIGLVGTGELGKAVLFDAALDTRVAVMMARLHDLTYRTEAARGGLSDMPGILATTDLPQLVGLVAGRPCWIQMDAKVSDQDLRSTFAWSLTMYERASKDQQALRLEAGSGEDWKSIAEWFAAHFEAQR